MSNKNGLLSSKDVSCTGDYDSNFYLRNSNPVVIDDLIANNIICDTLDLNGGLLTTTTNGTVLTLNGIPVAGGINTITGTAPINITAGSDPIVSLNNSGVTAGTFPLADVTVNAQGLITAINSGTVPPNDDWSSFPAQTNVNMNNFLINNLATPLVATDAATKGYVDTLDGNNVKLTGDQTVAGIKTFSSIPVCATMPTNNNQLANKEYVDSAVSADTLSNVLTAGNSAGVNQINMNSNKIINCADPTLAQDVATKIYVDTRPAETLSATLTAGNSAGTNTINMNNNQINNCSDPLLPQDVATKSYVDTRPTPTLAQVLTAGNTANMDINMNDFDISSVNDITMSGLLPTITATNVLANLTITSAATMNLITAGQMTLASSGIVSIGGATHTSVENVRIDNSVITKEPGQADLTVSDVETITGATTGITVQTISTNENLILNNATRTANLTAKFGGRTFQHYTDSFNQKAGVALTEPSIGLNRKMEVGIDIGGDYTRFIGLQQNNTVDTVLTYTPNSGNVFFRQIPIESNLYINGDLIVQSEIPNASFDNETYNVVNNGIEQAQGIISIPLTVNGNPATIPFFTRDGTPFPTNNISDNGQFFPAYPAIPTSGLVRCMVSDPYNPIVYVACFGANGNNGTLVFSFNISSNAWSQLFLIDGEVYNMLLDGNDLYIGGSFNNTESIAGGSPVSGKNIIRIEINTLTPIPVAGSLNGSVNCFAKWNGYIAVGGKFDNEILGFNFFQKFALYDKALNQFFNINQSTSTVLNDWGFNDQVYSIAVLPQTNTLLIGGSFTEQYANTTTYNYQKIVQYQVLGTFNSVGDGSLGNGVVSKIFVDYEGGLVYIAGEFSTSVGQYLVATPVNTLDRYKNIGWNGGGFPSGYETIITKDEIGGFIWLCNINDNSLWRFNPNVNINNAYESITNLLGFTDARAVMYSWFDRSVHISLQANDIYYRFYCDQRVKIKQNNGDLFVLNDGSEYDVLVLPKKGSSLTVRGGLATPSKWYVFGASQGVYGEWETGQITEPDSAYATALLTTSITGLGSQIVAWDSITGKNITLSSYQSGRIIVKQKGLYKMSFRVNAVRNGGGGGGATSDMFVWFILNNNNYQQTNTQFTIRGNTHPVSFYNEVFVELNIEDIVGVILECPTNDVDVITTPATATQPQVPGMIFNIQLVNPSREPFV